MHVPFECVSLDFTLDPPSSFERASAGLATGTSEEEARSVALLELIERDALSAFLDLGLADRLECELNVEAIQFSWFQEIAAKVRSLDALLRCFSLPSLTGTPIIAATIRDDRKDAKPYRAIVGHAAHADPEIALFKAVAEAAQSRLTYISASRDDCFPSHYLDPQRSMNFALAPPPVDDIEPMPFDQVQNCAQSVEQLAEWLASKGFDQTSFIKLRESHGFHIVRAFVPGLGSLAKERRL